MWVAAFASTMAILSARIRCLCQLHVGQGLAAVYLEQDARSFEGTHVALSLRYLRSPEDRGSGVLGCQAETRLLQPRGSSRTMWVCEA